MTVAAGGPQEARFDEQLFHSPEWFLSDLDLSRGLALLVRMTRQTYRESTFLDQRLTPAALPPRQLGIMELLTLYERSGVGQRPVRYIFHTAFCGSTLLSRCLDVPGACLSYKEPFPFHRIGDAIRAMVAGNAPAAQRQMAQRVLALVVAMLSRTYGEQELPLIKPSDSVNNLIPDVLALHRESRAMLLYFGLEDFAIAMLKRDGRREYLRRLLGRAQWYAARSPLFRNQRPTAGDDAQIAAFVWLTTMYECMDAQQRLGRRLCALNGRRFLEDPAGMLPAIVNALDLRFDEGQLHEALMSDALRQDSKRPGHSFDRASHRQRLDADRAALSDELKSCVQWAAPWLARRAVPEQFPGEIE